MYVHCRAVATQRTCTKTQWCDAVTVRVLGWCRFSGWASASTTNPHRRYQVVPTATPKPTHHRTARLILGTVGANARIAHLPHASAPGTTRRHRQHRQVAAALHVPSRHRRRHHWRRAILMRDVNGLHTYIIQAVHFTLATRK